MTDLKSLPVPLPVAVIGAGPVGLAAAARLIERNLQPAIFEKGQQVGAAISDWGHVQVFSPWRYNIDAAAAAMLDAAGWQRPCWTPPGGNGPRPTRCQPEQRSFGTT